MIDLYGFKTQEQHQEEVKYDVTPLQAFEDFVTGCHRQKPPTPKDYGADSPPSFAPPHHTPPRPSPTKSVDGYLMQPCLYTPTYLWLSNGQQFWFYPTFMGRRSVAGYRWSYSQWVYTGFGFDIIDSFTCPH